MQRMVALTNVFIIRHVPKMSMLNCYRRSEYNLLRHVRAYPRHHTVCLNVLLAVRNPLQMWLTRTCWSWRLMVTRG